MGAILNVPCIQNTNCTSQRSILVHYLETLILPTDSQRLGVSWGRAGTRSGIDPPKITEIIQPRIGKEQGSRKEWLPRLIYQVAPSLV